MPRVAGRGKTTGHGCYSFQRSSTLPSKAPLRRRGQPRCFAYVFIVARRKCPFERSGPLSDVSLEGAGDLAIDESAGIISPRLALSTEK